MMAFVFIFTYKLLSMPPAAFRGAGRPSVNIEKLQAGDPQHFQRLYKAYYRLFLGEARQLLTQKDEAAAIVNHSFIKCWLRSEAVSSKEYVFAFLRTTITRHCYECNNPKISNPEHQDQLLHNILTNTGFNGKGTKALLAELLRLPEAQTTGIREIFERVYKRNMKVQAIAEQTGLTEDEITASLNLAYKTLHVILSEELF
jgi:DNA-directed RNA polymerase specialized sigma24 family protein